MLDVRWSRRLLRPFTAVSGECKIPSFPPNRNMCKHKIKLSFRRILCRSKTLFIDQKSILIFVSPSDGLCSPSLIQRTFENVFSSNFVLLRFVAVIWNLLASVRWTHRSAHLARIVRMRSSKRAEIKIGRGWPKGKRKSMLTHRIAPHILFICRICDAVLYFSADASSSSRCPVARTPARCVCIRSSYTVKWIDDGEQSEGKMHHHRRLPVHYYFQSFYLSPTLVCAGLPSELLQYECVRVFRAHVFDFSVHLVLFSANNNENK